MNETSGNDNRGLLDANVNNSNTYGVLPGVQRHTSNTSGDGQAAKKKRVLIGIGALVGVGILVLILVLALSGGGDEPTPGPGPSPGPTPIPGGFDPYKFDQASIKKGLSNVTGVLEYTAQADHSEKINQVLKGESG